MSSEPLLALALALFDTGRPYWRSLKPGCYINLWLTPPFLASPGACSMPGLSGSAGAERKDPSPDPGPCG